MNNRPTTTARPAREQRHADRENDVHPRANATAHEFLALAFVPFAIPIVQPEPFVAAPWRGALRKYLIGDMP